MADHEHRKKFGAILVEGGLITPARLQQALDHGREKNIKIGQALLELGFVNETAIAKTLARQLKIPYIDLEKIVIDPEIVLVIPELVARKHKLIALGRRPGELLVAFADPLNIFASDEIIKYLKERLVTCVAIESGIMTAIDRYYAAASATTVHNETPGGEESEAVSVVNDLLLRAVQEEASDIHIEPTENKLRVRYRVDGILRQAKEFPMAMHPSILSRIKIMSQIDIGERRKPQDGRFELPIAGRHFDVRVSTLPLNPYEKVVMRLLDKSKIKISMQDLGFEAEQQTIFQKHLQHPHEIMLVTGPTGSGKTTTLYGALNFINSVEKNIVTVEDPVEYELMGVNQVQVNPKADLTFSTALRSILRQDPNVVMIGEIREVETAEIAIQAALTGHLVLTTLHTNDACSSISRLVDMRIPPFLIASALGLVVAQRLVRLLCPQCREKFAPPDAVREQMGLPVDDHRLLYRPKGCDKCDQKGYKGRIAIYETLAISREIEALIMTKASSHEIFRQAMAEGFLSLRRAGLRKMLAGLTSPAEILRLTLDTKE